MKQVVCLDGILRMGMYLITNLVSFYSFQTSDGFVMTTKYQITKIFATTKALKASTNRRFIFIFLLDW